MRSAHLVLFLIIPALLLVILFGYQNWKGGEVKRLLNSIPKECAELDKPFERSQCLSSYFKILTQKASAKTALARAQALEREGVIDDCHLPAHEIGQVNFQKNENNVGKAFATCPLGCIEGCFHGVMEEYVQQEGSVEAIVENVEAVCTSAHEDPLLQRQCIHGIGHGLLQHKTDDMSEAIAQCKKMEGDFYQHTCLGGMFMENVNAYLSLSEEQLQNELPQICANIDAELLPLCLEVVGEGLMFHTGHDLERSTELCYGLPQEHQTLCIDGATAEADTHTRNSTAP